MIASRLALEELVEVAKASPGQCESCTRHHDIWPSGRRSTGNAIAAPLAIAPPRLGQNINHNHNHQNALCSCSWRSGTE